MATVDRQDLVRQCKLYLPQSQPLSDEMIEALCEPIIILVGDDDTNLPEILCKGLYACGRKCLSDSLVDFGRLKREKTGNVEVEYHNNNGKSLWKAWLDNLKDVCPLFGYTPNTTTSKPKFQAISYNSPVTPIYPLVDCNNASGSNSEGFTL